MFRIKVWMPVEIDPKEDTLYITNEEAEKEKAHLETMQPENIYKIEEVEEEDSGAFIHAKDWKRLSADNIITSIAIGVSVLKEKGGFSREHSGELLVLVEDIVRGINEEEQLE